MTRFIVRRLLGMIPLMLGITFITFAIVHLVPGNPISKLPSDPRVRPQNQELLERSLGLDKPWPVQYVDWLGKLVRGDLGISLTNFRPVKDRILDALPNTLLLATTSFLLAFAFAVPLGVLSAIKHHSVFDRVVTVGSIASFAIPTFWLALMMQLLIGVKFFQWGWPALPVSGLYDPRGDRDLGDRVIHLIMPAVALAIVQLAGWIRYLRSSMLEVVHLDFVRTAEAKGLSRRAIMYGHALRNAMLPLVTLLGFSLPEFFAGAFIIERVFDYNGIGLLAVKAATDSDYTLIMGITVMLAALTLIGNLAADVAYGVLDPRIRYE
jgi:peptide/nickel transport system permease protein